MALSRLQRPKYAGVGEKQLVEYLTSTYSYLDGDIESQVMTVLLSCIKNGTVCAVGNGKYRVMTPTPKNMTAYCLTRSSHGPKCSCLAIVSKMCKASTPNTCCYIKNNVGKSSKGAAKKLKQKPATKPRGSKCKPGSRARTRSKLPGRKPVLKAPSKSTISSDGIFRSNPFLKCSYCLELHAPPSTCSVNADKSASDISFCPSSKKLTPSEDTLNFLRGF